MVVRATPQAIRDAAQTLRAGGLVAFPTETVYGLGASALDARAVARIFAVKERPAFDPLIVHVADEAMLRVVAYEVSSEARELMRRFWPGALTLVLPKRDAVPEIVTAGLPTVAVRMPSHPVALALVRETGVPIAAPSANRFGGLTPTRAQHVQRMLGDRVEWILDAGPAPLGIESTIVRLEPRPELLRPGAIPAEEIEAVTGPLARVAGDAGAPLAPGSLTHHYAPSTPLRVVADDGAPLAERAGAGYLGFARGAEGYAAVRILSPSGDLTEAAAQLFDLLHELDTLHLERIDAAQVPETGLGLAIADRLRRAAN